MKFVDAPKIISFGYLLVTCSRPLGATFTLVTYEHAWKLSYLFSFVPKLRGRALFPLCILIYYHGDLIGQLL